MKMFRWWVLAIALAACGESGTEINNETVEVACASCQLEMEGAEGCFWAARIRGKTVTVRGDALPREHDSHAPDGMCNVTRGAVVSGTLHDTWLDATRFDLQPVEPAANPEFTHEDEH